MEAKARLRYTKIMLKKAMILAFFSASIISFYWFDLHQHFSLQSLQKLYLNLEEYRSLHFGFLALLYFLGYVFVCLACLPGISVINIFGGVLFGWGLGSTLSLLAVCFSSTISFWLARYLFRDFIQKKFSQRLARMENEIKEEGGLMLFSLRLVPVIPYFLLTILFGATPLKTRSFVLATFFGLLPMTLLYTQVGAQLSHRFVELKNLSDLFSWSLFGSLVALASFPFIAKKLILPHLFKKKEILKHAD